jgi:hypothetical protein
MIRAITLGVAKSNGAISIIDSTSDLSAQIAALPTLNSGGSYARIEVWEREQGLVTFNDYVQDLSDVADGYAITITAMSYTINYGDACPTFAYTTQNIRPGENPISGTAVYTIKNGSSTIAENAVKTTAPGEYDIKLSGLTVTGYEYSIVDGALTIEKAPLAIKADNKSMNEKAAAPAYSVTATGFKNDQTVSALTGSASYTIKDADGETVENVSTAEPGTYRIIPSGYTSANYAISYEEGVLTIAALPDITITADNKTMTAGGSAPEYTCTATGDFEDGEDISDLSGSATYVIRDGNGDVVADVTTAEAGTYSINVSGYTSTKYDISFVAGTLTIEAGE